MRIPYLVLVSEVYNSLNRSNVFFVPNTRVERTNATAGRYASCFDADETCATSCKTAQMN